MTERRYRVLFVGSHPVQYAAPVFREMAQRGDLDIQVAYCSLQGAEPGVDAGFGVEVAWDVPLLEGYPWVRVANRSPWPGLGRFFGPFNPGLWNLVREREYDAVVIYTGYRCANFWIVAAAAKLSGVPLLFGTDAHELRSVDGRAWKKRLKQWLWPQLFRLADVVIVPSSRGAALMRSLGTEEQRLVVTPYVVDNNWWTTQAERVDPAAVRREWQPSLFSAPSCNPGSARTTSCEHSQRLARLKHTWYTPAKGPCGANSKPRPSRWVSQQEYASSDSETSRSSPAFTGRRTCWCCRPSTMPLA
jgi:hypothetical protein